MVLHEKVWIGSEVDMFDDSTTAVKGAAGVMEGLEVKVELYQVSALSPFCLQW